ncbi:Transferase [Penicillium waksmanii]|uniref:Transferase n=1 Tax=Penicillium waksmanii TaxID=69791 RepID=UPI002546C171|nr:Transferase [Penicillium waksmanii]KAJ5980365.1 Transferase [Penicillium waksmanii]
MPVPNQETLQLHPFGWEEDPEEERFKVSTLDYLTACTYNNYALFFRMEDSMKCRAIEVLKLGLERTLSQTRHLCGTIEKDREGGHSFVKKKDDTVKFVVQRLDLEGDTYPSFDQIEKENFRTAFLGDLNLWSVAPMTYGEKPEALPDSSPVVAAYKANFIRGGLVLNLHHHHYANDVMGWAGFARQLSENCYAVFNNTAFPSWDPACLDVSRLTKADLPDEAKVDGPPAPDRHPDHTVSEFLLFHLPKRKAAELKTLASRNNNETWISTFDAFAAFILRTMTRLRAPVFKTDLSKPIFYGHAVDMRRRMHSPNVSARLQHNVMMGAISEMAPIPAPTAAEVISDWPLSRLAAYIRSLTKSTTQEFLDQTLEMIAPVRDKTALNIRGDSKPPLSVILTDHREASMSTADFGFATPALYRHLLDYVSEGIYVIYPPRDPSSGSDSGPEFSIAYERHLKDALLADPEWNQYFEYYGVDAIDARFE